MTVNEMSAVESAVRTAKDFHRLQVVEVESLCDDAAAITFGVPASLSSEFSFQPGQSLILRRVIDGAEHRRNYSICATMGAPPRIGVREVPGGLFSRWLVHEVRPGDHVEVQRPTGSFVADPALAGRHVMVAAGSGITPMLSIASSVLCNPESSVALIYGNRRASSVMFTEELADLKDAYQSRFELVHVLSREPRSADLLSGHLDAERLRRILTTLVVVDAADHIWLCGPAAVVTAAQRVLEDLGVDAAKVHRELFYVEDTEPPPVRRDVSESIGPSSAVTIVLDGRSSTLDLPRDTTVLDAAQQFRADLPFACKGGVCGTCRARVSDGQVEMGRNYALDEAEVEAGFVLTCQSLPLTDHVTVDFDC